MNGTVKMKILDLEQDDAARFGGDEIRRWQLRDGILIEMGIPENGASLSKIEAQQPIFTGEYEQEEF